LALLSWTIGFAMWSVTAATTLSLLLARLAPLYRQSALFGKCTRRRRRYGVYRRCQSQRRQRHFATSAGFLSGFGPRFVKTEAMDFGTGY
jgi:hypothetical protein